MTEVPDVTDTDGWDDPLPLGWRTDLPPFPGGVLPGVLGDYAAALAEATQTPPDLAGGVTLGVISGCIGGRVRVWARPGWTEPTNLWVVPVLHSGTRKSAVMDAAGSPLLDAEQVLQETISTSRRDATIERDARTKYATKLLNDAAKDCDPAALAEAQKAAAEAEEVQVPPWPQLTVDDSTPEALVTVLAEQGGRVVAMSAEAGLFDVLAGSAYNKRSKVETILKAHAGDTIRVNRQIREPQLVRRPALTLICTIQPYALRTLVTNAEYAGRGLVQRALWSLPADNVGYRKVGAAPVSEDLADKYRELVVRLAVRMGAATGTTTLRLSDAAAEEHLGYERQVEEMLRPDGPMGTTDLTRSWGSKLAGATVRIAAALHYASVPAEDRISAETMRAAVTLAEYYRTHADAALHPADNQAATDAQALLSWLTGRTGRFTARDIRRGAPRRFRDDAALTRKTLAALVELGWCRAAAAGGWELHPQAAEHLKACDTCDTNNESAGHGRRTAAVTASHQGATSGDTPSATVASRRIAVRRDGDTEKPPATSGNAETVAPVARVAPVCRVCGQPIDPVIRMVWHSRRLHPKCAPEANRA